MDFTPGIFALRYPEYRSNNQVNTTLAKQLAYYVVIYSPLQMAADLPENYEDQPAFQFIRDVPCDWEQTLALDGEIGDFAVIARQDRNSADWYLGAITDEEARDLTIALDFLEAGVTYTATIYADGPGAHWDNDPFPLTIHEQTITSADTLALALAPGGGVAVRFAPIP
jgi:alpha-glucosidase